MESKVSGHWTDDQLIDYLYGVGREDDHLSGCVGCQARLSSMQGNRRTFESSGSLADDVSFEFLAAQRRKIYGKITEPVRWWSHGQFRRWASAAVTVLVLSGAMFVYEQKHQQGDNRVSDAQLALEVSNMVQDSEPQATVPLQQLFEE